MSWIYNGAHILYTPDNKEIYEQLKNKCMLFAEESLKTHVDHYSKRNQNSASSIKDQIFVGKISEVLVYSYLKRILSNISRPDFKIYSSNTKNWNPDLYNKAYNFHVKSQTIQSSINNGISWIIQIDKKGEHRDTNILKPSTKDFHVFTLYDSLNFKILAILPTLQIINFLEEPRVESLKEIKKAIYYSSLAKQIGQLIPLKFIEKNI